MGLDKSLYSVRMSPKKKPHNGTRDLSVRERAYLYIQQLIINGTLAAGGGSLSSHWPRNWAAAALQSVRR